MWERQAQLLAGSSVGKCWSASCCFHLSLLNPSNPHPVSWSPRGVAKRGLAELAFFCLLRAPRGPTGIPSGNLCPLSCHCRLQTLSAESWPASLGLPCFVWGFECVEMGLPVERRLTVGQREPWAR